MEQPGHLAHLEHLGVPLPELTVPVPVWRVLGGILHTRDNCAGRGGRREGSVLLAQHWEELCTSCTTTTIDHHLLGRTLTGWLKLLTGAEGALERLAHLSTSTHHLGAGLLELTVLQEALTGLGEHSPELREATSALRETTGALVDTHREILQSAGRESLLREAATHVVLGRLERSPSEEERLFLYTLQGHHPRQGITPLGRSWQKQVLRGVETPRVLENLARQISHGDGSPLPEDLQEDLEAVVAHWDAALDSLLVAPLEVVAVRAPRRKRRSDLERVQRSWGEESFLVLPHAVRKWLHGQGVYHVGDPTHANADVLETAGALWTTTPGDLQKPRNAWEAALALHGTGPVQ